MNSQFRYFTRRSSGKGFSQDKDDDIESVGSEDFEKYLADSGTLDFASEIKPKAKDKKKAKSSRQREDDGADEGDGSGSESYLDVAENASEEDFDEDDDFKNAFNDFDDMLNEDVSGVRLDAAAAGDADDDEDDEDDDGDDDGDELGFREEDVEFSDGINLFYISR